ncbi:MAG: hypothetical protein HC879_20895 [Leptolyngbyaceae cyanobacterium SL_5_9]|nr:hypothetical protein [Leptolyngbyaceae cyanobacterium SL_5_9]NJO76311.1 hypothetical protein [Leptolyngbyaceae cyanobacterium RM1_406_9]
MATAQGNTPNPTGVPVNSTVPIRAAATGDTTPTGWGLVEARSQRLPNNLDTESASGPIEGQIYPRAT